MKVQNSLHLEKSERVFRKRTKGGKEKRGTEKRRNRCRGKKRKEKKRTFETFRGTDPPGKTLSKGRGGKRTMAGFMSRRKKEGGGGARCCAAAPCRKRGFASVRPRKLHQKWKKKGWMILPPGKEKRQTGFRRNRKGKKKKQNWSSLPVVNVLEEKKKG